MKKVDGNCRGGWRHCLCFPPISQGAVQGVLTAALGGLVLAAAIQSQHAHDHIDSVAKLVRCLTKQVLGPLFQGGEVD